jgi:hypothetical protein
MKLLILTLLVSVNAMALECKKVSYDVNKKMREELMLEGKGAWEIDEIMDARWAACYGKCGPLNSSFENCLPKMSKEEK